MVASFALVWLSRALDRPDDARTSAREFPGQAWGGASCFSLVVTRALLPFPQKKTPLLLG